MLVKLFFWQKGIPTVSSSLFRSIANSPTHLSTWADYPETHVFFPVWAGSCGKFSNPSASIICRENPLIQIKHDRELTQTFGRLWTENGRNSGITVGKRGKTVKLGAGNGNEKNIFNVICYNRFPVAASAESVMRLTWPSWPPPPQPPNRSLTWTDPERRCNPWGIGDSVT